MSMLSAQCDELRKWADQLSERENEFGVVVRALVASLREAADTIWELRCKCADLMGEREEYVWTREFMDRMAKHCGTKDCPSLVAYVEGLEAENAKLRELCMDMYRCSDPCNDCPHYNGSSSDFYCRLGIGWKARRMRELGVEVDG